MKSSIKTAIMASCVGIFFVFLYYIINITKFGHDFYTQDLVHCDGSTNTWLVNYATEDSLANRNALNISAINKCIHGIISYAPVDIRDQTHFSVKPYILLKAMDSIPKNDYILYVDNGIRISSPIDGFVAKLSQANFVVFNNYHMDAKQTSYFAFKNNDQSRKILLEWQKHAETTSIFSVLASQYSHDFISLDAKDVYNWFYVRRSAIDH